MKNFIKTTIALTVLFSIFSTSKLHAKNADNEPIKIVIVIKP